MRSLSMKELRRELRDSVRNRRSKPHQERVKQYASDLLDYVPEAEKDQVLAGLLASQAMRDVREAYENDVELDGRPVEDPVLSIEPTEWAFGNDMNQNEFERCLTRQQRNVVGRLKAITRRRQTYETQYGYKSPTNLIVFLEQISPSTARKRRRLASLIFEV